MGPIAILVRDDPWLTMLPEGRLIAFRERRERLYGNRPRDITPEAVAAQTDPPRQLPPMKEPWFRIVDVTPHRIRVVDIIEACALRYKVLVGDIISARRKAEVVRPRQVACFLARHLTLRSLPEIGRRMGDRDHTTMIASIRKIERLRQTDTCLEMDLRVIAAAVGGHLGR